MDALLAEFLALPADGRTAWLEALDPERFAELQAALTAHVDSLLADDAAGVEDLSAAADARDAVQGEDTRRAEAAASAAAERDAARARLLGTDSTGEQTVEPDLTEQPADEGTEPVEPVGQPTPIREEAGEPVAASAPVTNVPARPSPLPAVAAAAGRPAPRRAAAPQPRGALVAAADVRNISAGTTLNREQLVQVMTDKVNSLGVRTMQPGAERVALAASLVTEYPADRTLGVDPQVNGLRMESFAREAAKPGALTAAGGLCAPLAADYSLLTLNTDERPVRDGLPQMGVTRGGVRYVPPRRLADVTNGFGVWTVADDESAIDGDPTKSRARLACQDEVEVLLYAVYQRIVFGNMNARAYPEQVDQDLSVLAAAHARLAERSLLGAIKAKGKAVSTAKLLGASRDLLAQLDVACAYLRDQHRLASNSPLEVILPRHVRALMRADLTRQMPTDLQGQPMAVTDAQLDEHLSRRGVTPIISLETAATASGAAFPTQGTGTALVDFPDTVEWDLFPAGSFQYLDGGEITFGAVRDSTLNATNDYEMFGESFEAVAFRGVESLHVTSTVQPDGSAAGLVATSAVDL